MAAIVVAAVVSRAGHGFQGWALSVSGLKRLCMKETKGRGERRPSKKQDSLGFQTSMMGCQTVGTQQQKAQILRNIAMRSLKPKKNVRRPWTGSDQRSNQSRILSHILNTYGKPHKQDITAKAFPSPSPSPLLLSSN